MTSVTFSPRYPRTVLPKQALTVMQAMDGAPNLARLAAIANLSQEWLIAVSHILPSALRSGILAGPIEDKVWCLIAKSSAVAAKLRQISPTLCAHLRAQGCEINAIRIKVQMGHHNPP